MARYAACPLEVSCICHSQPLLGERQYLFSTIACHVLRGLMYSQILNANYLS
jgi:hypothetical protein